MKKMLTLSLLAVAALLGISQTDIAEQLYLSDASEPAVFSSTGDSNARKAETEKQKNRKSRPRRKIKTARLEEPAFLTDRPEEVVWHTAYTVSFNRKHKLPNWVAWVLTKERTEGQEPRCDDFQPDPDIRKGKTAEDGDYRNSGFDRGHICPAADNKADAQTMKECFYLSNICPQLHSLNGGDWKELEEKSRKWARRYGCIYIAGGPIIKEGKHRTIGDSRVTVPDGFFKVILRITDKGEAKAIGFIYPHEKCNRPMQDYAVSVDEVERQTGIDFFCRLPKDVEKKAEAECNFNDWK